MQRQRYLPLSPSTDVTGFVMLSLVRFSYVQLTVAGILLVCNMSAFVAVSLTL